MNQIGYSLIDSQGTEVLFWGDTPGSCEAPPTVITLPTGDHVLSPNLGPHQEWRLVYRMHEYGPSASITFDGEQTIVTTVAPLAYLPDTISDRQFFQQLAVEGLITNAEALAAVQVGTIPPAMEAFLTMLPSGDQFAAQMLLCGATSFYRYHPLTIAFATGMGKTEAELDAIWLAASKL